MHYAGDHRSYRFLRQLEHDDVGRASNDTLPCPVCCVIFASSRCAASGLSFAYKRSNNAGW